MNITQGKFGKTPDGTQVGLYKLSNAVGTEANILTYGGIIQSLKVPDRDGRFADVVLGFDTLDGYLNDKFYIGALIGRFANRIARGSFVLDGRQYSLARNFGEHHLHGGVKGFDKVVWDAEARKDHGTAAVQLVYTSKHGEEGYPGNLSCTVTYSLTDANELRIAYEAVTDKPTIVNLTNHSYFNLAGGRVADITGHELQLNADRYTPVDQTLLPSGKIASVEGTPLDFRKTTPIGSHFARVGGGYDHNFIINQSKKSPAMAARVHEPLTGRVMDVLTTQPGIQFYTGNFLDGSARGKGVVFNKHAAFCLETQHFPDSPNRPNFPSVVLRPGEKYSHVTVFRFSAD